MLLTACESDNQNTENATEQQENFFTEPLNIDFGNDFELVNYYTASETDKLISHLIEFLTIDVKNETEEYKDVPKEGSIQIKHLSYSDAKNDTVFSTQLLEGVTPFTYKETKEFATVEELCSSFKSIYATASEIRITYGKNTPYRLAWK